MAADEAKKVVAFGVILEIIGGALLFAFCKGGLELKVLEIFVVAIIYLICCFFIIKPFLNIINSEKTFLEKTDSVIAAVDAFHTEGLPGCGYQSCSIGIRKDDVYIKSNSSEFTLKYNKIYNAITTTEYEIVQSIQTTAKTKGTAGKALIGGLLFGVPGAIVGAATAQKVNSSSTINNNNVPTKKYFIINYEKDNQLICISFEGSLYSNFEVLQNEINSRTPKNNGVVDL